MSVEGGNEQLIDGTNKSNPVPTLKPVAVRSNIKPNFFSMLALTLTTSTLI
jgi:hypothetical protein